MKTPSDTPVLIVGAGPIGLSVALDLGWRGVACTIVDQSDGSIDLPRGAMVSVRTMEYCRRWGIAARVKRAGFPRDYKLDMVYCTSLAGYLLARDEYPAQGDRPPLPFSPEVRQWCPQLLFDPLMARVVSELPQVRMRYRLRMDEFTQHPDHVLARLSDTTTGEQQEIRAQYLVACDGSTSLVRQALGIEQEGNPKLSYSINIFFRCPALLAAHDKGQAERYLFVDRNGTWGNITVVDGGESWRLTVIGSAEKMDLTQLDAAAEVCRAIGRDDVPFELIAVRPWRRSEQICRDYHRGRVFLAGEAAHTMSPTGGFGMNTGVIDAANLGWKLQATLDGWAGAHLLESYGSEQRPIAVRNALASTRNFHFWVGVRALCGPILDATQEGERVRADVGRQLKETLVEEWESVGVQAGFWYENSPICWPDGTPPPPDPPTTVLQTARPGSRAPHAWLADGRSTLDLFGQGFVLLRLGSAPPDVSALVAAADARRVPLDISDIAAPEIAALYQRRLVLVRPDGHVAWRDDDMPDDPMRLIDIVRGAMAMNT